MAFIQLASCRGIGMDLGPIPVTDVIRYAETVGFRNWELLFRVVTAVDIKTRPKK